MGPRTSLLAQKCHALARSFFLALICLTLIVEPSLAQPGAPGQQGQQSPSSQQKPSEAPPAEAGGPQGDVGPYAVPKKKEEAPPPRRRPHPRKYPACRLFHPG